MPNFPKRPKEDPFREACMRRIASEKVKDDSKYDIFEMEKSWDNTVSHQPKGKSPASEKLRIRDEEKKE